MKPSDWWALVGVSLLFLTITVSVIDVPWKTGTEPVPVADNETVTSETVAGSLFTEYAVALPIIALLLGASMIGGIYLAKEEK